MKKLPVLNCDACGACCQYSGTPPGYDAFFPPPGEETLDADTDEPDRARFLELPAEAYQELDDYFVELHAGRVEDRAKLGYPCMWFDPHSLRCRHYEFRPQACRDFEVGEGACLAMREYSGVE